MTLGLADLELFAAVARTRSFRGAARELGLSPSSLSERLRAMETRLGARLLNRTTRSVSLTAAGETLLAGLAPALAEIEEAMDRAAGLAASPAGRLRINAPGPAAVLVLTPLLAEFLARHPRLQVELTVEDQFVDIVEAGFDAGVRYDESLAKDMIAIPLGPPERFAVVASPACLARWGRPETPDGLLTRPCIRHRFGAGAPIAWPLEKDGQSLSLRVEGPLVTNNAEVELRAALEGIGFLATFEGLARPYLQDGRLVEVLADWCEPYPGPLLYYPSRRHMPAALRALVDFIRERNGRAAG